MFGEMEAHRALLSSISTSPHAEVLLESIQIAILASSGSPQEMRGLAVLERLGITAAFSSSIPDPVTSTQAPPLSSSSEALCACPAVPILRELLILTQMVGQGRRGCGCQRRRVSALLHAEFLRLQGLQHLYEEEELAHVGDSADDTTIFQASPSSLPSPCTPSSIRGEGADSSSASSGGGGGASTTATSTRLQTQLEELNIATEAFHYMEAYTHYLHGFVSLWRELFGPHKRFSVAAEVWRRRAKGLDVTDDDGVSAAAAASSAAPQVPPHVFAVRWQSALTRERKVWYQGFHQVTRELVYRLVRTELPASFYPFFVLYAALSLRLRLLETNAEVFVWSAAYVDVGYCTQQLYLSYHAQREMAQLQEVWDSFKLTDQSFIAECRRFNQSCNAVQGAFVESIYVVRRRAPCRRHAGEDDGWTMTDEEEERESRVAAATGEELSPTDEDQLSGEFSSTAIAVEKEVYTPLFHTCCYFAWILQRSFWSLYGRSSLLFSSCIHLHLAPTAPQQIPRSLRCHRRVLRHSHESQELRVSAAAATSTSGGKCIKLAPVLPPPRSHSARRDRERNASPSPVPTMASAPLGADPLSSLARAVMRRFSPYVQHGSRDSTAVCRVPPETGAVESSQQTYQTPEASEAKAAATSVTKERLDEEEEVSAVAVPPSTSQTSSPFHFHYDGHSLMPDLTSAAATGAEVANDVDDFLKMSGCYVLAEAVAQALNHPRYPSTFIVLSDNTTRPGRMNWVNHKYVLSSVSDDETHRGGFAPWVLNFVLPRSRLSMDAKTRAAQEELLLTSLVFQLAGREQEGQVASVLKNSAVYVLNSGPLLDGGRMYFALHLNLGPPEQRCGVAEEVLMERERQHAVFLLENVLAAWVMSCTCNEAVRLAVSVADEEF